MPAVPLLQVGKRSTGAPRVEFDTESFNFGIMDVGQAGKHDFVVRNIGAAPLKLRSHGTSCKCTLIDIADGSLAPGKAARVRLEWTTPEPTEEFRHGAIVGTNDPDRSRVSLILVGRVRPSRALAPDSLVFSDVQAGDWRTQRVVVYATQSELLEITHVESSLANLSWQTVEADKEDLQGLPATCGTVLEVTLDPDLPLGPFVADLKVHVAVTGEQDAAGGKKLVEKPPLVLRIGGNRLGYWSMYGPIADGRGFLDIGPVPQADGVRHHISLQVRGDKRGIKILDVRTRPNVLRATVTRDKSLSKRSARFRVDLEIPPNSPLTDCMGQKVGELELLTDDPELSSIRVPVEFAIHP